MIVENLGDLELTETRCEKKDRITHITLDREEAATHST